MTGFFSELAVQITAAAKRHAAIVGQHAQKAVDEYRDVPSGIERCGDAEARISELRAQ